MTGGFPLVTACKIEIGTVTGKGPAVMEGPDDSLATNPQIVKQQADMNIIAVNVVKPDHIRIIVSDPV